MNEWMIRGVPFSFAKPEILPWLWLSLLLIFVLTLAARRYQRRFLQMIHPNHYESLAKQAGLPLLRPSRWRALLQGSFWLAGWIFLLLAIAGPRYGYEEQEAKTSGIDLLIAIDLSLSMQAEDVKPSRLVQAKREVLDLLTRLKGDRVGIIAFAGIAFVQCPLTADYDSLRLFLDHLDAGVIPSQGTSVASAMDLAGKTFATSSAANSAGKALLIISDGEDQDSKPLQAAKTLHDAGVALYVMGVGTEQGAPIPIEGGGFKKDEQGQMVISKLNIASLHDIARAGGGRYVQAEPGESDLDLIWTQGIQAEVQAAERSVGMRRHWHEYFQWALWPALLLLMFEYWMRPFRVSRRHLRSDASVAKTKMLLFFIVGGGLSTKLSAEQSVTLLNDQRQAARQAYEKGEFEQAAKSYIQAEVQRPEDEGLRYERAVAQYRAGQYADAEKGFISLAEAKNSDLKKRARFNRGNAAAMHKDYQGAVDAFETFLKDNPDDQEAKENLEWAKKMLDQPPQDEQKKSKDDQKKKEDDQKQENKDQQQKKDGDQQQDNKDQQQENKDQQQKKDGDQQQDNKDQQQKNKDQDSQAKKDQGQGQEPEKPEDSEKQAASDAKQQPQAAGEAQPVGDQEKKAEEAAEAEEEEEEEEEVRDLRAAGQLSKEAAERLLRRLGDQGDKIRIPIPNRQQPEQNSNRDW